MIENVPAHTTRRLSETLCSKTALFSSTNFGEVYVFDELHYSPIFGNVKKKILILPQANEKLSSPTCIANGDFAGKSHSHRHVVGELRITFCKELNVMCGKLPHEIRRRVHGCQRWV